MGAAARLHTATSNVASVVASTASKAVPVGTTSARTATAVSTGVVATKASAYSATQILGMAGTVLGVLGNVVEGSAALYSLKSGHVIERQAAAAVLRLETVKAHCEEVRLSIVDLP